MVYEFDQLPRIRIRGVQKRLGNIRITPDAQSSEADIVRVDPADRLPPELVFSIFMMLLPGDFVEPDPTTAPLSVAQVSRQWREIALSCGQLWRSLSVLMTRPAFDYATMMRTWLARAGACDLTVTFSSDFDVSLNAPCLDVLASFSPMIQCLRVLASTSTIAALVEKMAEPLPRLKRVALRFTSVYGLPGSSSEDLAMIDLAALVDRAPRCTRLSVYTWNWHRSQEITLFPLERLTRLTPASWSSTHAMVLTSPTGDRLLLSPRFRNSR